MPYFCHTSSKLRMAVRPLDSPLVGFKLASLLSRLAGWVDRSVDKAAAVTAFWRSGVDLHSAACPLRGPLRGLQRQMSSLGQAFSTPFATFSFDRDVPRFPPET